MGRSYKSYEVGYGEPPVSSRFKPGQAGNKSGRPKKRPRLIEQFGQDLNRRRVIRENGEARSLTTTQIVVKQLIAQAAKGQQKFLTFLFEIIQELDAANQRRKESSSIMSLTKDDIEKMTDQERTEAYKRLIDLSSSG